MSNHALVSIIIPAYNAEKFIAEALESALSQAYKNIEVIVVDDGSKDRTAEIVQVYAKKDKRVKYIWQKNQGQSSARNAAISRAAGDYIAFLDADDLFLPAKLEEQVNYLETHPECGVSYCKIYHFINNDPHKLYYFELPHPSGNIFADLLKSNFINPLSVVLRKELIDRHGGFENAFRRMDEQYLWLKLSYHGAKFEYLDQPLGLYRIHPAGLTNDPQYFYETEARFLDLINMMKKWMSSEEAQRYDLDAIYNRSQKRLMLGKLLAMPNPLGRLLLYIYRKRRLGRLKPVNIL